MRESEREGDCKGAISTNELSAIILQETRKLSERGVRTEKEEEEIVPISQSDDIHDIIRERGVRDRDSKPQ